MPTVKAGSSVVVTVAAGKSLKVSTEGEAVIQRLYGLIGSPHSSDRVSAGVREYQSRDLPFSVQISAIAGAAGYEIAFPSASPKDVMFRRNDGGKIDAVVDPATGKAILFNAGRPLDRHINITGDSRTANSVGVSGATVTFENYGHGAWYTTLTRGAVRISAARKSATPGHTTADWVDNMPAYIAAGGDVFVNMIGTNYRNATNNFSLERSKRNIETGLRMQIDAGKIPLFFAELPRGGASALTGTQLSIHKALREWVLGRLPERGARVADPWPLLVDPANEEAGLPIEAYFVDSLHLNGVGAPLTAGTMAPHLIDLYGAPLMLPTYDAPYDATYNKSGWLTANPLMLGTSGTKSASANATGVVADGWNLAGSSWTGGTVTCSKEVNPDGGEYQVLELGGTPTSAGSTLTLEQVIPLASLANGNILRGIGKVVHENLSGVGGVNVELRFVRGGTAYFCKSLDRYAEGYQMIGDKIDGPQETPYLTIDATETEVKLRFVIYGCQNVPIRGKVKVGQLTSEKVL